jgi:hypothetical protein
MNSLPVVPRLSLIKNRGIKETPETQAENSENDHAQHFDQDSMGHNPGGGRASRDRRGGGTGR